MDRFRRRSGIAALLLFGVIARALIPAGFMPAALAAGGPFVVCHGGLAGEFFRQIAAVQHDRAVVASGSEAGRHEPAAGHNADDLRHALAVPAEHAAHADHGAHAVHGAQGPVQDHAGFDAPASALAQADHDQQSDHSAVDEASHEAWENCPIGAAFAAAVLSGDFDLPLLDFDHALESPEPALPARLSFVSSYRARAPPIFRV